MITTTTITTGTCHTRTAARRVRVAGAVPTSTARRTRTALIGAVTLAAAALLTAAPASARVETPQDGAWAAQSSAASDTHEAQADAFGPVTRSRLAGMYGVHVDGGWLLR